MKRFLDDEAQTDLDRFVNLYQNPQNTKEWWREFVEADRRVSQWLEHGRISPQIRETLLQAFKEIDGWLVKHYPG